MKNKKKITIKETNSIEALKNKELIDIKGGTFGYDCGLFVGRIAKANINLTACLLDPFGLILNRV